MAKGRGIKDVDPAVLKAMVAQAKMNTACLKAGELTQYCCACRSPVLQRWARPGRDLIDSRYKMLEDKWDGVAPGYHQSVRAIICEPCNRVYFDGEKWLGHVK